MLARSPSNLAAELGPSKFSWWQDWRGECVAIIASGPSAKKANIAALRDRIHVIAIKENVDLWSWAEVVYGCDWPWWRTRLGLPKYRGLKVAWDGNARTHYPDIRIIEIRDPKLDKILTDEPACLGSGRNSGFQAVNLAVQFGVTGILLIGFDMHGRNGEHWYGRNNWMNGNNPDADSYRKWIAAFDGVAGDLKARGVDVVNASPSSDLNCFRRATIEDSLTGWGL